MLHMIFIQVAYLYVTYIVIQVADDDDASLVSNSSLNTFISSTYLMNSGR